MTKRIKITGIIVLAVTLLAGTALAQGYGERGIHGGGPAGGEMMHNAGRGPGHDAEFGPGNLARCRMIFRNLNLTDEQWEEVEYILTNTREQIESIESEVGLQDHRTSFIELFTSYTLTVDDLEETLGVSSETREAMRVVIFEAIVDLHDVLTPEQLDELASIATQHEMGHGPLR